MVVRTRQQSRRIKWAAPLLAAVLAGGCGSGPTIPGTEIPDTEENRQIIQTLERYRSGFVRMDPTSILATAHPTYSDTAGTDDPSDDIVYEELGPLLRTRMSQLDSVRFTIDYLDVNVQKDRAVVKVWIDASFYLDPPSPDEEVPAVVSARYSRLQDHAMFELVREQDTWLITSGM